MRILADILLLEDDKLLNDGIKIALNKDGHEVCQCYSVFQAEKFNKEKSFDVMLLDINLPDGSGLDFCKSIRSKGESVPVIFITANDTENDMLLGFANGCDDYIAKPFSISVLCQKIIAILKRTAAGENTSKLKYKNMLINFDKKQVLINDEVCHLTSTEYKLIEIMAKNRGKALTRNMLLEQIWDIDGNFIDENTLSVHIKRLRSKIEPDAKNPQYIKTVFGIGYTFGD